MLFRLVADADKPVFASRFGFIHAAVGNRYQVFPGLAVVGLAFRNAYTDGKERSVWTQAQAIFI